MSKIWSWIAGLFTAKNIKTSAAGTVVLAGTALKAYSMYTNPASITPEGLATVTSGAAMGLGLLAAKDANGAPLPPVKQVVEGLDKATFAIQDVEPLYAPIKATIEAAGQKASDEAKAAAIMQAVAALSGATGPVGPAGLIGATGPQGPAGPVLDPNLVRPAGTL